MTKSYSPEVRNAVGVSWAYVIIFAMSSFLSMAIYCIVTWSFTWWLPAFFIVVYVTSHRYGYLLDREEKKREKLKDRQNAQ